MTDDEVDKAKRRLGRGLAALIGEAGLDLNQTSDTRHDLLFIPIAELAPNPQNPRKTFDPEELDDLAGSIRDKGILQPILARRVENRSHPYEIVAGERRWQAAQRAGLHEVPVLLRQIDDTQSIAIALIENIQRTDLNPLEEAGGYQNLMTQFGYGQNDIARLIGKSRSHIANVLRLLKLPSTIQDRLKSGQLSFGHARALLASDAPDVLADRIVDESLSVRQTENLVRRPDKNPQKSRDAQQQRDTETTDNGDLRRLELSLARITGARVSIRVKASARRSGEAGALRGALSIEFESTDQLNELCGYFGIGSPRPAERLHHPGNPAP